MGIKINVTTKGTFSRELKGEGTGPRGGRVVFEDTGRTMVGIATEIADKAMSNTTLKKMAAVMVREVKIAVPKDTKALKNSIRSEIGKSSKGRKQARVLAGGPGKMVRPTKNAPTGLVDYAIKVHETNTPYMFDGIRNAKELMEEEMAKGLKKATKGKKK